MPKTSTYKRIRSSPAKREPDGAKSAAQRAAGSVKASRSTRYRLLYAAMDAQIAQIKVTLDAAERMMDEVEAS